MNQTERKAREERRVIHPATYLIRHDSGDCFQIEAHTLARARKLIEAECADRGWDILDTDYVEIEEK